MTAYDRTLAFLDAAVSDIERDEAEIDARIIAQTAAARPVTTADLHDVDEAIAVFVRRGDTDKARAAAWYGEVA